MVIDTKVFDQLDVAFVKNILGSDNLGIDLSIIDERYSRLETHKARRQVE